ncbi:MAG: class I SAM-dependent rRNA methyltransferase [Planctomycetes bacterium]|nr:class I SAM-dependent rRNA methyltransferase [Planctomycetota bacterium]
MTTEPESAAAAAPAPATADVRLSAKASGFARRGQVWFYGSDVEAGDLLPPRLARVRDEAGRDLGLGFTSAGRLALRLCGPWPGDAVPDREAFFHQRLLAAIERRAGMLGPHDGARLVHGESDGLPGLVLDRYGPVLVLQVTSAVVEHALDAVVPFVAERLQAESVVARDDVPARKHEGLPQEVRLLHGRRLTEVTIVEHGVRHLVRPFTGHKTGFYLDQRPARALVQQLAKGRRVLDLFCYQGAFALNALQGGATVALAVDESEAALQLATAGAAANALAGLSAHQGNVFDFVRGQRDAGRQHDLIVLDPPAFAKSRRELDGAERGYRDLNRHALRLLAPQGFLVTCTCSHHMALPRFEEIVRQAAAGLPFRVVLRQRLGAGPDHPVTITHPESEYLKVLLLQRQD